MQWNLQRIRLKYTLEKWENGEWLTNHTLLWNTYAMSSSYVLKHLKICREGRSYKHPCFTINMFILYRRNPSYFEIFQYFGIVLLFIYTWATYTAYNVQVNHPTYISYITYATDSLSSYYIDDGAVHRNENWKIWDFPISLEIEFCHCCQVRRHIMTRWVILSHLLYIHLVHGIIEDE